MNPEAPKLNPEYQPPSPDMGEHLPNIERGGVNSHEHEQNTSQAERQATPPPIAVPLPLPIAALPVITAPVVPDDSVGPVLASDDDVIEKEWVDKAKKIITETQNDPYKREQEVNKLQTDYLRKRYGKELGTSN
ncbi:MAG: hypothetical protein JWN75_1033 [Candidatus Saccharibacteria bacterium]|nr:hypothetical protein [Candidatus Saccharibacteria bacterium]